MDLSVNEFARKQGISRARVHQLIKAKEIKARKVGHQWIIPAQEIAHKPKIGRPFSPRMANAFIKYLSNIDIAENLDPSEKARLKARINQIKENPDPANLLRSWLKNRSESLELNIGAKDFNKLLKDENLLISGAYNPLSGLSGASIIEGYIQKQDLKKIIKRHLLVESPNPNVKIRVIDEPLPKSLPIGYLLADLSENYGARERRRVKEIVSNL